MNRGFGYFEEDKLGKIRDWSIWRRLFTYMRPYYKGLAGGVFLALLVIAASLALPYLVRLAIDSYIINESLEMSLRLAGLTRLTALFVLMTIISFGANCLQVQVLEWTGQHLMHDIRQHLFTHLLDLDLAFFNENQSGKLVTRLTNDIQNMHEMFTSVVVTLFNDFLQLACILTILFFLNWKLALVMTIFLPLITLNTVLFSMLARQVFRSIRTKLALINSYIQESIGGISILQLFSQQQETRERFMALNHSYYNKTIRQISIFGTFMPILDLMASAATAAIIWYGGGQVIQDSMTLGVLTAFVFYMRLFFKPARELSQKYSIVQSAMASAERIFQLLDQKNGLLFTNTPMFPEKTMGSIDFLQVEFAYHDGETVLQNFDLQIKAGESIALVGATGSGKSTVINLLERLYDPIKGKILLDGNDLRQLNLKWLREQIGLVIQEMVILPGTIRENIAFGEEISEPVLDQVLKKAQFSKVMDKLPQGLETIIGDGGYELSTGQKQLLSLSRVLVRNPRIMILDEATSNIDSETEMLVEQAMKTTMAGRTSIIIAHRLSTITHVDRIMVMDQGRIIEQGSHQQLLAQGGHYKKLIKLQNNGRNENDQHSPACH